MRRDKSRDLYIFRRRELEIILNELCEVIDGIKKLLDEERRLSCKSWDTREETSDNFLNGTDIVGQSRRGSCHPTFIRP